MTTGDIESKNLNGSGGAKMDTGVNTEARLKLELRQPGNIDKRLKFAREKKKLSQSAAGKAMGLSASAWGHWEGARVSPSDEHLTNAAKVLGISPQWLKLGTGDMKPNGTAPLSSFDHDKVLESLGKTIPEELLDPANYHRRLRFAQDFRGWTAEHVAKTCGISKQSFWAHTSEAKSGRRPRPAFFAKYAHGLGVRREWLELGEGDMLPPAEIAKHQPPQTQAAPLDPSKEKKEEPKAEASPEYLQHLADQYGRAKARKEEAEKDMAALAEQMAAVVLSKRS